MNILFVVLVCAFLCFPLELKADPEVVGCVNGSPIYASDFQRLMTAQSTKFEKSLVFDPWQPVSVAALENRNKLIEEARRKNFLVVPRDVENYRLQFSKKLADYGPPLNTYDLKSYAEENALLLQMFKIQAQKNIQDSLIEKKLLLTEARIRKLQIAPQEIENRMEEIKGKYGGDEGFRDFLRRSNSTEVELRVSLEEQLLIEKLKERLMSAANLEAEGESGADRLSVWLKDAKEKSVLEFSLPGEEKMLSCAISAGAPKPKSHFNAATPIESKSKNWQSALFKLPRKNKGELTAEEPDLPKRGWKKLMKFKRN